jgi:hypothetical protein
MTMATVRTLWPAIFPEARGRSSRPAGMNGLESRVVISVPEGDLRAQLKGRDGLHFFARTSPADHSSRRPWPHTIQEPRSARDVTFGPNSNPSHFPPGPRFLAHSWPRPGGVKPVLVGYPIYRPIPRQYARALCESIWLDDDCISRPCIRDHSAAPFFVLAEVSLPSVPVHQPAPSPRRTACRVPCPRHAANGSGNKHRRECRVGSLDSDQPQIDSQLSRKTGLSKVVKYRARGAGKNTPGHYLGRRSPE